MGRRFTLSRHNGTQTELRFKQDGVWTPDAYSAKAEKARKRKGKKGRKVHVQRHLFLKEHHNEKINPSYSAKNTECHK
ncbi:Mu-like prophage tail protein gpP [Rodentibacter pneumotropicus]|uniref:Mu-like prophage tail protein gpP n=1 Tax=Rodentibacter pneumotropicus TaxID=758 RepID=A0A448MQ47_9PAST|nr:Mu-like prophage tail protein gpP [Rodentibacter pneumotropicus]